MMPSPSVDRGWAPREAPPGRRAGCDARCLWLKAFVSGQPGRQGLWLHDPDAHEAYGLWAAWRRVDGAALPDVVRTGRLAVHCATYRAAVDGAMIHLTPTQLRLLLTLAASVGRTVLADELVAAVQGVVAAGAVSTRFNRHWLRVNIGRLRAALGDVAILVETTKDFGYRLRDEPPVDVEEQAPPPPRWSMHHAACVDCGSTERPHKALGFCIRCHNWSRELKARPVGRPRKDALL